MASHIPKSINIQSNKPVHFFIKRTATPGKEPGFEQLEVGELCVNTEDGKMYTKDINNQIVQIKRMSDLVSKKWTKLTGLAIGEFVFKLPG